MRASHDHPTSRSNVDTGDGLVMAFEFIFQGELVARFAVKLDVVVASNCECLPVCRERVIGNRVVEQMMDLWGGHGH